MKATVLLPVLLIGAVLAGPAAADVIRLRNGNSLQGEARVLPNGDVEVHSAMGMWKVPAARVLEVVESETAEERVAKALARRPPPSASELFELALDVRDEGSVTLSRRLLERVVELEPEHAEARRALGQRRLGESWVSDEEYRAARGEVRFRGEWTDPEAAASVLELEALEAVREREAAERRLQDAQLQMLYQERLLRFEELERQRQASYGIPLDAIWGWGGIVGVPVFPVMPPKQRHPDRPPVVSPPAPAPQPPSVAPQHNRSSLRRVGD